MYLLSANGELHLPDLTITMSGYALLPWSLLELRFRYQTTVALAGLIPNKLPPTALETDPPNYFLPALTGSADYRLEEVANRGDIPLTPRRWALQ